MLCISAVLFSQAIEKNTIEEISVFKFYPNPVQEDLFILGTHKIKSIEFLNALGELIGTYHFNKRIIKMNVSEFKSGIYLIQVIDENNNSEIKRLVIE
jgi:hypothetical protein